MKKILSMIFVGLILLSTFTLAYDERQRDYDLPCEFMQSTTEISCSEVGPNYVPSEQIQLDIVFVIDSTGSMHDEIRTVKEELRNIVGKVNSGYPRPDVRVGVVTYRDYEPYEHSYLTRETPLTRNTKDAVKFIKSIESYGGGDYEEAVEAGLDEAINHMNWRSSAHKIIILVGDAPARNYPNQNYYGNEPEPNYHKYNWKDAIDDAQDKNIRIYTASGSGMNQEGMNQWKTIARKTGGSHINLFYERRNVREYYEERAIPVEYMHETRTAPDYEAASDSVMTNNFGIFAGKALMQEATAAGVEYNSDSLEDLTGDFVREPTNTKFKNFLERVISNLMFWK